jgi:signal transduction histidine kinase
LIPDRSKEEPLRLLDFAAPLRRQGQMIGVLGAHLSWEWAEERRALAQGSLAADLRVEVLVYDLRGQLILGPARPPLEGVSDRLPALREAAAILSWGDGRRYLSAAHGSQRYESYPGMDWTVVVRQPEATAMASADRLERRMWVLASIGTVLFGLGGWWLALRLTAPLRALSWRAEKARAALSAGPRDHGGDEVTQIAHALSALLVRLDERDAALTAANASLEARVQQRTESLRLALEDLRSFSRSVSHDLKGPIASIGMVLKNLLQDHGSRFDATPRATLSVLVRECERLRVLVDELLMLSMVEERELQAAPVSMYQLAADALATLQLAQTRPAQVLIDVLPDVAGDAVLLGQVWQNLLANALKFSARVERPQVRVSATSSSDEVVFCVADNGAGFDMSQAGRLFSVFQRLHRASDYAGTGVGLSIVKRVVHRHGGRVWAEGEPGRGARFYFALPQRPAALQYSTLTTTLSA